MTKSERRIRVLLTAVRLTPAERDFIAQKANEAGESLSGFMREAALQRGRWTTAEDRP